MKCRKSILFFLAVAVLLAGCGKKQRGAEADPRVYHGNAVYYWKTVFDLSEGDSLFLQRNDVGRLYVKFFDVVLQDEAAVPEADVVFRSRVPEGVEVVPTVFITVEALRESEPDLLARKIHKRVHATPGLAACLQRKR